MSLNILGDANPQKNKAKIKYKVFKVKVVTFEDV